MNSSDRIHPYGFCFTKNRRWKRASSPCHPIAESRIRRCPIKCSSTRRTLFRTSTHKSSSNNNSRASTSVRPSRKTPRPPLAARSRSLSTERPSRDTTNNNKRKRLVLTNKKSKVFFAAKKSWRQKFSFSRTFFEGHDHVDIQILVVFSS